MNLLSSNPFDSNMTPSSVRGDSKQEDDSSEVITNSAVLTSTSQHQDQTCAANFHKLGQRQPIPARQHERRGVSVEMRGGRAGRKFSWDETADWRYLSQPCQRRTTSCFGLKSTTSTSTSALQSTTFFSSAADGNFFPLHQILGTGGNEQGSHSLTGSELRAHFFSLDQAVVKESIEEHINNVEAELEKLRKEREQILRELAEEDEEDIEMDEQWKEGVMAIDEFMGL